MFQLLSRFAKGLLAGTLLVSSAFAATTNPHITVRPQARILTKIDNTKLSTVPASHPGRVAGLADQGRVPASTQFNHMMLVLKSTDEQEQALHGLLDEQQDKSSPNYHQWATPETFGAAFGVASPDIAKITSWLQDSGFSIDTVTKGARFIQFSGTSGAVEAAFHTEMHQYLVNGELRVSNSTDISIPAALSPVVLGVGTLNNFRLKSSMVKAGTALMGKDGAFHPALTGSASPDYTSLSSSNHYVGAGDLAVIYDTKPLLAAGINGAGQKIALLGQTDILLGDIQIYRSMFNLPPSSPNFITVGNDPGTIADDGESDLDVEVSGAFAPGATIDFYLSGNSYFGGGIDASGVYVVENNSDDVVSLSYGECEADLGTFNAFFDELWEQAASQGITAFVSTGDSGSDVCDDGSTTGRSYSVNGLGSTPYNIAVGGTEFNDGPALGTTQYWGPGAGAPYTTALGYIPEIAWNEGRYDIYTGGYGGIVAASSGISIEYGIPSYQVGPGIGSTDPTPLTGTVTGFQVAGPHRLVPDVSLEAAGEHDGTIYCSEGSCKFNADGTVAGIGVVGGTSVAAPSMAGVQALVNQQNGGRQGLANYYYYRLAAAQSLTNCNAATLPSAAGATCAFHDVQTGNDDIPTTTTGTIAGGQYLGWPVGPGYDLNVGLGSPDVANLATQWKNVTFNATKTTLALTPTTSTHGTALNTTITVTPVSGTGSPTGDVSIIASAAYGAVGFYTLASGSNTITGTLTGLPGGTYNVYAHYAGDATYGGSNSAPVQVTVSTGASSVIATPYLLSTRGGLTQTSTFTYGSNVYIDAQVCDPTGLAAGGCAVGTPTGTITFTLNNGVANLPTLASPLDSFDDAYFDSGLGYAGYDIKPNYPSVAAPALLPPGTYKVTAAYSGDSTFNASTAPVFSIVVGPAAQALSLTTSTATIPSGGTATLNASITTIAPTVGGLPATGTVTFTDNTTSTVLGTATLTNGAVVFTTTKLTTNGAHSITAVYSGDVNYLASTSTAVTITVGGTASTTTLAITTVAGVAVTTAQVGTSVVLTATVPTTATGTVYFYDGAVLLGTGAVSTSTHLATRTVTNFTAGTHVLTANYAGNGTLDASTSAASSLVIAQNTPTVQLTTQSSNATGVGVSMNAVLAPSPVNAYPISPAPTGAINFLDGSTVLGSATAVFLPGGYDNFVASFTTPVLKPGPHVLTAKYPGDTNFAGATSNTQTINIGLTTLSISSSVTSIGAGIPFTLTATVTPIVANTAPIGGTVTFYDGTRVIGTATVTAGVATLPTATLLGVGSHTVTAIYSGDSNYYTSSATLGVAIVTVTPSFSISVNPTSLTIIRGQSGTVTVTDTVVGNYNGFANFSCSGLPANTYCTFSQPAFTMDGTNSSEKVTLTISTLAPAAASGGVHTAGFLWIPAIMLAAFLGLRRKQLSVRGRQLMVLGVLLFGMMATGGCGSGVTTGTPAGSSTVLITAAGVGVTSASANIAPSASLALTIQ